MKTLLIIDPQKDFCEGGALPVTGATEDCKRLAGFVEGILPDTILVTLDSHRYIDIAHPAFWKNDKAENPKPFETIISVEDVENGVWKTTHPDRQEQALKYVKALAEGGRYPLCIWPPHCIIGHAGQNIQDTLGLALMEWELKTLGIVHCIAKGTNPMTEHYSAYKAEVVDPYDSTTFPNKNLLYTVKSADVTYIGGEALDYCVANTVRDIVNDPEFGEENIKKLVLLEDCTSPVGFPKGLDKQFLDEMTSRGMKVCKSTEI